MKCLITSLAIVLGILLSVLSGSPAVTSVDSCPPKYETIPGLLYQGPIYNENGDVVGHFNGIICHAEDPTPNVYCFLPIKNE